MCDIAPATSTTGSSQAGYIGHFRHRAAITAAQVESHCLMPAAALMAVRVAHRAKGAGNLAHAEAALPGGLAVEGDIALLLHAGFGSERANSLAIATHQPDFISRVLNERYGNE